MKAFICALLGFEEDGPATACVSEKTTTFALEEDTVCKAVSSSDSEMDRSMLHLRDVRTTHLRLILKLRRSTLRSRLTSQYQTIPLLIQNLPSVSSRAVCLQQTYPSVSP